MQGVERQTLLITDQNDFLAFLEHARTRPLLAIDTEFLREKTYWPKLCLLQLGTDERFAAVDPFAVTDLAPLRALLEDEGIVKLFHAASQDMEILYHELGTVAKNCFDTQIAASLLGDTTQIGYGTLVFNELGIKLKKADSFTDWSQRPLTASQLEYALDDVIYLPQLYEVMTQKLKRLGRLEWLAPDFAELSDVSRYMVDPRERYTHLRRANQLGARQLACAREIAAWREETAMRRNLHRKLIISDEQIVEICKREPSTINELFMVRGVKGLLTMAEARHVLTLVDKGLKTPEESLPRLPRAPRSEANVDSLVDLLCALLKQRAREAGVAFAVLASHDDLTQVARGHFDDVDVLKGWRRALVGEELLDLVEGKTALCIQDGSLKVTELPR